MKKVITIVMITFISLSLSAIGEFIVPADNEVMKVWNESLERPDNLAQFNMLVWNVKKMDMKGAKEDLLKFSKSNDLLLIQEFASSEKLEAYWNDFKDHRIDFAISFLKDDEYQTGVANITNLKMDNLFWIRSIGREPIIFTPKVMIIATYDFNGKNVMIANIHSINFVDDDVYISELKRIEEILSSHNGPLIFAGDFNCWKKIRKKALDDLARKLNLTYTVFPDREKVVWGTVDHVLYRGVKIMDPHVLKDVDSSDHKPMTMKVVID